MLSTMSSYKYLISICMSWIQHVAYTGSCVPKMAKYRFYSRSPCRLNLQIFCTDERPLRRTLDVWPPLLIKICYYGFQKSTGFLKYKFGDDVDNIIAALEHNDRVCEMTLF